MAGTNGHAKTLPDSAAAWWAGAEELADWAWKRFVNRTDVWGGYFSKKLDDGTTKTEQTTRPAKVRRGAVTLGKAHLIQHFKATTTKHVVGCHTTSPENTSRFGAVDIDWHGEGGNSARPTSPRRWVGTRSWRSSISRHS